MYSERSFGSAHKSGLPHLGAGPAELGGVGRAGGGGAAEPDKLRRAERDGEMSISLCSNYRLPAVVMAPSIRSAPTWAESANPEAASKVECSIVYVAIMDYHQ